jgi:hypothetical protein
MNKVSVSIVIDENGQATATVKGLNEGLNNFAQGASRTASTATASFAVMDREAGRLRETLNSNEAALHNLARQYDQIAAKSKNAFSVGLAQEGARQAREQAGRVSGFSNEFAFGDVSGARFQQIKEGAGQAKEVVSNLRVGVASLRDELGKEPPGGSSRFFNVAQGMLFRDIIRDSIRYAVDFGKALLASYQEATAAQQALIVASIDYGQQIEANIRAARELAVSNQGAVTGTEAQKVQAVALMAAGRAGQPSEAARISQAALDLAAKRLPDTADAAKILQQYLQGSSAAAEALVGPFSTDEHVLQRFADATHRSAKELTEQEKVLARIQELERRGGLFPGAAAERAQLIGVQVDKATSSLEGYAEVFARHPSLLLVGQVAFGGLPTLVAHAEALNLSLARQPTSTLADQERDAQIGAQEQGLGATDAAREDARKRVQRQLEDFQERLNATSSDPHLSQRQSGLSTLQSEFRGLEKELSRFPELIDQSGINKVSDRLGNSLEKTTQEIVRQQEEAMKKLATLRVEAISLIDTLTARAAHDNPFVKLFSDGDKAIESIRLKFAPKFSLTFFDVLRSIANLHFHGRLMLSPYVVTT